MGAIPEKKCSTSEKNQYSMIEVLAKISSHTFINTKNIVDFILLIQKKNLQKIKEYCKQNRHFYQDVFEGFQIFDRSKPAC
jgi:hypothetical protein